jgi:hypothetical protein
MVELISAISGSARSMDFTRMPNCSLRVLGGTLTAIPELTKLCRSEPPGARRRRRVASRPPRSAPGTMRSRQIGRRAREDWDASPIALPRRMVWEVIKTEGGVLTACTLQDWSASKL